MQKTREFRESFANFPEEVQKLFDYDSNLFIQSFLDGSLDSALATLNKPEPKSEPEPKTEPEPVPNPDGGNAQWMVCFLLCFF